MRRLGPSDPSRARTADELLPLARAAGIEAGVTRLAEITRLDRFGLPVWQAVRPMGRGLSVHQGKGATDADAQVGALLEAVESHAAEHFDEPGPVCRWRDLPEDQRAPDLADFARLREEPPAEDDCHRWVVAENLLSGAVLHLPFDVVSLDFTRGLPSPFERTSNGLASGASRQDAILAALHEFIERDAVASWQARGLVERMASTLDLESVPFQWLALWRERLDRAGATMRLYRVPTLTGTPLFTCEINDLNKDIRFYQVNQGRGCHADPEVALFKALAEALQARLTVVAGARDDLFPSSYVSSAGRGIEVAFGLPLPPGMSGIGWRAIEPGPVTPASLGARLAKAGYPDIAVIDLAAPEGIAVTRAFVCGLGSMRRRRRDPVA